MKFEIKLPLLETLATAKKIQSSDIKAGDKLRVIYHDSQKAETIVDTKVSRVVDDSVEVTFKGWLDGAEDYKKITKQIPITSVKKSLPIDGGGMFVNIGLLKD
jgi:outer membrane lipoprotein-sorting protein